MNHYAPREIIKDGKGCGLWHYTCRNDDHTYATGNCSPWSECPHCRGFSPGNGEVVIGCEQCRNTGMVSKDDPCLGHATPEEACEHQKQYFLDTAHFGGHDSHHQSKCQVCQQWTDRLVTYGHGFMSVAILCDKHATREYLEPLVRVGVCSSSC